MATDEYNLTTNQRAFADEYIINKGNATQAYLKAYPNVTKETTAHSASSRLLRNVKVANYIAGRTEKAMNAKKMSGDDIIIALASIARREQQTSYSKQYDHLEKKVIKEITYTFNPSIEEATRALETLVKWAGLDNPNNDLIRKKLQADTDIARNKADKDGRDSNNINVVIKPLNVSDDDADS